MTRKKILWISTGVQAPLAVGLIAAIGIIWSAIAFLGSPSLLGGTQQLRDPDLPGALGGVGYLVGGYALLPDDAERILEDTAPIWDVALWILPTTVVLVGAMPAIISSSSPQRSLTAFLFSFILCFGGVLGPSTLIATAFQKILTVFPIVIFILTTMLMLLIASPMLVLRLNEKVWPPE